MPLAISVVVIAKNEETRIADCLESVQGWAEEIVVLDDESTDKTRLIAGRYTSKVISRVMDLEGRHRNFGASQAKNDWVMMLDCDERLTPELKAEIEAELKGRPEKTVAYWAPKKNFLGKVQLKYGGWSNPRLKLYDRRFVQWSEAPYDVVHPGIRIAEGYQKKNLQSPFLHYDFRNIEDFVRKVNRYSTLEAIKWHLSNRKMTLGKAIWRSIDRFFRRLVGKKGYKDGFYGFVAACVSGFHEILAYGKYREIKEFNAYISEGPKS